MAQATVHHPNIGESTPPTTTPPERIQAILDRVPRDANRVLDLGCARHDVERRARGDLHAHLVERIDGEVVGVDYVADAVEAMRNEGYDVRMADAQGFHLNETFDVVVAGDLIEHLSRPGAMLDSVHNHLHADGRFIASTPNAWCWYFIAQTLRGHVHCNEEHTCWYDARTLRQLIERHGFTTDIEYVTNIPESIMQHTLRAMFRTIRRLPVAKMQRAPTLLAVASPQA